MILHDLLVKSFQNRRKHLAVIEGNGSGKIDYEKLNWLSDRMRDRLVKMGVRRGDRVGIFMRKSIDGVASILGILKAGAAYVPVDPTAPAARNAYIHHNCGVKVIVLEKQFEAAYKEEMVKAGYLPRFIVLDKSGGGKQLENALNALDLKSPAPIVSIENSEPDDLAYILYTSGSTGNPKGVMISHRNATSFVDWCSEYFKLKESDIFSSHAPFHFDLSIFDIYVSLCHGATLVLISEEIGKEPNSLAKLISDYQITIWYSAPSTLSMMAQFGNIPKQDFSSLRMVLFAGEVFPVVHLRSFKQQVSYPRYFNLYGPTETNVCTCYEIPSMIPDDRVEPYPIGETCSHLESIVIDSDGNNVTFGIEGELCIAGPSVMQGYWDMSGQTEKAFLPMSKNGKKWYKTGDIVVLESDGNYRYIGRRDRMVKKRGYRIELGEIEACLYQHPSIIEVAVVSYPDDLAGVIIKAHLSTKNGKRLSIIELKSFCSQHLPVYMVPDAFTFHNTLPKTSTDKIDYMSLINPD